MKKSKSKGRSPLEGEYLTPELKEKALQNLENPRYNAAYGTKYPFDVKVQCIALRTAGLSYQKIEDLTNVPLATVHAWCTYEALDPDIVEASNEVAGKLKESLRDRLMLNAEAFFARSMDDEKVDRASTWDLVRSGAVMIDKARLISGESTSNVAMAYKSLDRSQDKRKQVSQEIAKIESEIARLKSDD